MLYRVGSYVRIGRKLLGQSIYEAGKEYGVKPSTLAAWETGKLPPNDTLVDVAWRVTNDASSHSNGWTESKSTRIKKELLYICSYENIIRALSGRFCVERLAFHVFLWYVNTILRYEDVEPYEVSKDVLRTIFDYMGNHAHNVMDEYKLINTYLSTFLTVSVGYTSSLPEEKRQVIEMTKAQLDKESPIYDNNYLLPYPFYELLYDTAQETKEELASYLDMTIKVAFPVVDKQLEYLNENKGILTLRDLVDAVDIIMLMTDNSLSLDLDRLSFRCHDYVTTQEGDISGRLLAFTVKSLTDKEENLHCQVLSANDNRS